MYITGLYRLSHVLGLSVRILRSLRDNIPRQCEENVCSFMRHLPDKASYFYLRYRPLILVAMATACLLWFIIRPQADHSATLKQDATPNHSRVFQDRRRARGEADSRRRFFVCDFCTSFCKPFPTLLWAIFRRNFFKSYTRQLRMNSVGWNGLRGCKTYADIGTLRKTTSALQ
jgi:hypothetical protein